MERNEELIFASLFFLLGLCVMVLLGRAAGVVSGGSLAGLSFMVMRTQPGRVAMLTLACLVGLSITVHAGATPRGIIADLSQVLTGRGRLALLAGFGPDSTLRLGYGLVGGCICGLVLAVFCGQGDDGPS